MNLRSLPGKPEFRKLLPLINAEWDPLIFGEKTEDERILLFENDWDSDTDVMKLLQSDSGETVGFYRYAAPWPREGSCPGEAHTLDIAVLPEYRGRGFGKAMMNDLITDCRTRSFRLLRSRTIKTNRNSIALHKTCGFTLDFETEKSLVWILHLT